MSNHLDQPSGDSCLGVVALAALAVVIPIVLLMRATPPEPIVPDPPADMALVVTTSTTAAPTTTSPTMAPPPTSVTTALAPRPRAADGRFRSTAYCLTGTMASGRRTYVGAVAGNRWPLGTVLTAWPNPWGDPAMEFIVEDRHARSNANGFPTEIDFAMPGECNRALEWGNRRYVDVTVIGGEL